MMHDYMQMMGYTTPHLRKTTINVYVLVLSELRQATKVAAY
jgi:hypothetical protein